MVGDGSFRRAGSHGSTAGKDARRYTAFGRAMIVEFSIRFVRAKAAWLPRLRDSRRSPKSPSGLIRAIRVSFLFLLHQFVTNLHAAWFVGDLPDSCQNSLIH